VPRRWTLRHDGIGDLDALVALENAVFTTDILSRRSFCRFLAAPNVGVIVAEERGKLDGCSNFPRQPSRIARRPCRRAILRDRTEVLDFQSRPVVISRSP
jgi:hypothetical protein